MSLRLVTVMLVLAAAACGGGGPADACVATVTSPCPPIDTTTTPTNVTTGFVTKTLVDQGNTYGFQVFIPANYNSTTVKLPVILFLHGSSEKGTDNVKQMTVGLGPYVKARESTFPAIVVFPQGPPGEGLAAILTVDRVSYGALTQVLTEYTKTDPARVYMTGLSYGGFRAFEIAYQHPTTFAAIVPIAASILPVGLSGSTSTTFTQGVQLAVNGLKSIPMSQFHGAVDGNVPVTQAREISAAFKSAGAPFTYTEYPTGGHAIWDAVYADANMWTWLYAQSR